MFKNCQVCGNPVFSVGDFGTDADGRLNRDYCASCYRGGHFYARDWSRSNAETPVPMAFAGLYGGQTRYNGTGLLS